MRKIITEKMCDCSTEEVFCFSLTCEVCGRVWKSSLKHFTKAGQSPKEEGKRVIYQKLYQREQERARVQAIQEAMNLFSICPICERLSCDHCFLVCDDIDMCCQCADKLQAVGSVVRNQLDVESGSARTFDCKNHFNGYAIASKSSKTG